MPKKKVIKKRVVKKGVTKKVIKKKVMGEVLLKKPKSKGPDALTLALYLISFILVVFGSWYHKISWLLFGFVPFLVAIWYEYVKHHL